LNSSIGEDNGCHVLVLVDPLAGSISKCSRKNPRRHPA
jgi:hypothetical protein